VTVRNNVILQGDKSGVHGYLPT